MPKRKKATTKKAAAKRVQVTKAALPETAIESVLLLMSKGLHGERLRDVSVKAAKISESIVDDVISEAGRRHVATADFDLKVERAHSITHWRDLYELAHRQQDLTAAATARKNLDSLLKLHVPPHIEAPVGPAVSAKNLEAEAILAHLVPLKLAPESAPLAEHCRTAALKIISIMVESE